MVTGECKLESWYLRADNNEIQSDFECYSYLLFYSAHS